MLLSFGGVPGRSTGPDEKSGMQLMRCARSAIDDEARARLVSADDCGLRTKVGRDRPESRSREYAYFRHESVVVNLSFDSENRTASSASSASRRPLG